MDFTTPLADIHKIYGEKALVSRIKGYNIIHLDDPDDNEIKKRILEIEKGMMNNDLAADCPICGLFRGKPCDIVYYRKT